MKITLKCNTFCIFAFVTMLLLFYWLCPAPQSGLGKVLLYGGWGLFCFFANFIVIQHKNY